MFPAVHGEVGLPVCGELQFGPPPRDSLPWYGASRCTIKNNPCPVTVCIYIFNLNYVHVLIGRGRT